MPDVKYTLQHLRRRLSALLLGLVAVLLGLAFARLDGWLMALSLLLAAVLGLLWWSQRASEAQAERLAQALATREQAEQRLAAQEARFETMFES